MAGNFYLIVVDHDRKIYSVHGSATDDTSWAVSVIDSRRTGRDVQLAGSVQLTSREEAKAEALTRYPGYTLVGAVLCGSPVEAVAD
jgi:hypothetical protein